MILASVFQSHEISIEVITICLQDMYALIFCMNVSECHHHRCCNGGFEGPTMC